MYILKNNAEHECECLIVHIAMRMVDTVKGLLDYLLPIQCLINITQFIGKRVISIYISVGVSDMMRWSKCYVEVGKLDNIDPFGVVNYFTFRFAAFKSVTEEYY